MSNGHFQTTVLCIGHFGKILRGHIFGTRCMPELPAALTAHLLVAIHRFQEFGEDAKFFSLLAQSSAEPT